MEIKIIVPRNEVVMVNEDGVPLYVEPLTEGETLVDVGTYNDRIKPFHNGKEWIESATAEEITLARPTPIKPPTSIEEQLAREIILLQNQLNQLTNPKVV